MKQEIDPRLGILIAIGGALLLLGIGVWVFMRPSATPVATASPPPKAPTTSTVVSTGTGGRPALSTKSREMFEAHQRPQR